MMMDGLEDAYETGRSMGDFGEATAEAYQFTRADQDKYAMETLTHTLEKACVLVTLMFVLGRTGFVARLAEPPPSAAVRPARQDPLLALAGAAEGLFPL